MAQPGTLLGDKQNTIDRVVPGISRAKVAGRCGLGAGSVSTEAGRRRSRVMGQGVFVLVVIAIALLWVGQAVELAIGSYPFNALIGIPLGVAFIVSHLMVPVCEGLGGGEANWALRGVGLFWAGTVGVGIVVLLAELLWSMMI